MRALDVTLGVALVALAALLASPVVLAGPARKEAGMRKPAVIAFFGDSTVRGYKSHSGEQVPVSMPEAFAEAVGRGYLVLNEGADSSRVEHLLAGTDGRHPPWASYIAAADIDTVITNHASKNGNPVSRYKEDLRAMVRTARGHGKRVILMTPTPIAEGGLEAYVAAMRELAAEEDLPLIDVYHFLQQYMHATGLTVTDIVPDGYHPADAIYVMAGRFAAAEFRKLERKADRSGRD